jgi:hypothetical protein
MKQESPTLLGWNEAVAILRSVNDPVTSQLMNVANFEVIRRFSKQEELPNGDFDMQFFMSVLKNFCSDHDTLRRILSGEDLRLFSEDDQL